MARVGSVDGGVSPKRDGRVAATAAGQPAPTRPWELTLTGDDPGLRAGDLIVSVADPAVAFRLAGLSRSLVYPIWDVERVSPAPTIPPA
jgi:hypothetical protein